MASSKRWHGGSATTRQGGLLLFLQQVYCLKNTQTERRRYMSQHGSAEALFFFFFFFFHALRERQRRKSSETWHLVAAQTFITICVNCQTQTLTHENWVFKYFSNYLSEEMASENMNRGRMNSTSEHCATLTPLKTWLERVAQ